MMVFPCYHHRSKEGEPWPAKPAVIIHSSSTNICLLRFRSYRKKGERWLFPAAIVRRKWTLQVIPASICKAVSGITTNIQKRLSGCSWKDERSYFPLPSFLREPTKKSIPADVRMDTLRVKINTRYLPITRRSNSSKTGSSPDSASSLVRSSQFLSDFHQTCSALQWRDRAGISPVFPIKPLQAPVPYYAVSPLPNRLRQ